MADWSTAVIAVGGTLAGTGLGGYLGWLTERSRWGREQRTRWLDERRLLYTTIVRECEETIRKMADEGPVEPTWQDISAIVQPLKQTVTPLLTELELVGNDADAETARALLDATRHLLIEVLRPPDSEDAEDEDAYADASLEAAAKASEQWRAALAAFKDQARAGLSTV